MNKEVNDQHRAEAKRLIEVFYIGKLNDIKLNTVAEVIVEKAKENALKCCDGIVKELEIPEYLFESPGIKDHIKNRLNFYESVKQAIEDYETHY